MACAVVVVPALAAASEPLPPAPPVEAAPADAVPSSAAARVALMTTRERAASIVMGHIPTSSTSALRDYMELNDLGGFILMGSNVPADEAGLRKVTEALTLDATLPPLIAIDQEGGVVSRIRWDAFAPPRELRSKGADATRQAFGGRASLLARAGVNVNFGIVADYTGDSRSFIYSRVLGTTPAISARNVAAAVSGERGLVASTLKHFPGHGAAPGDSHAGIPSTNRSKAKWRENEALPFIAGIERGAELVMLGHLAYTAVDAKPASLSPEWHRILREELGFTGVTITDDLGMLQASRITRYRDPVANAVEAVAAGNDMVLVVMFSDARTAAQIVDGLVAAVESGALPAERLREAAERVMSLRLSLAASGTAMMPCGSCTEASR